MNSLNNDYVISKSQIKFLIRQNVLDTVKVDTNGFQQIWFGESELQAPLRMGEEML